MATATIALMPGDGIGPEVVAPCVRLLEQAANAHGAELRWRDAPAGAALFAKTGEALPSDSMKIAREADAILLGAMGMPDIRYEDGTEIAPQLDLRFELDLYAGVRPVRVFAPQFSPLKSAEAEEIDFVLIRESTEGLFASRGKGEIVAASDPKTGGNDEEARETLRITRRTTERLFDFSFKLAQRRAAHRSSYGARRPRVSSVDKANVFRAFAFMRAIGAERAAAFPDVAYDHIYVDAMALKMVQSPWAFDVLVTENMFGDILSDLGAGVMGGLGMAPSADLGDQHGVFQPCHGSAPDIAGQGIANPTATILSGAMMLDWLGEKLAAPGLTAAGAAIDAAVQDAYQAGDIHPREFGGADGTDAISTAIEERLAARLAQGTAQGTPQRAAPDAAPGGRAP